MTIKYVITDEIYRRGDGNRVSYGIDVYISPAPKCTDAAIASVSDITSDKTRLAKLVRKCNDLQLSPDHLYDVIEDFFVN